MSNLEKKNIDSLENKGVNDLFDFSHSGEKSPNIQKEKIGYGVIKTELQKLYDPNKKFTVDDINQAFFSYSGKEMNKVAQGPMKDRIEEKRRDVLFELQKTEPRDDVRVRLSAIAKMSIDITEITGAASGAGKKGDTEMRKDMNNESKQNELFDRMKEFKELIAQSQIEAQEKARNNIQSAQSKGDKSQGMRSPEAERLAQAHLENQAAFI